MRKLRDIIFMYFYLDVMRGSYARFYLAAMCLINLGICYVLIHQNNVIQQQSVIMKVLLHDWLECTGHLFGK